MPNHPLVEIHTYPTPITVAYKTIRESIPRLIFSDSVKALSSHHPHGNSNPSHSHSSYDIILHIGMAPGRDFFTLETCAHRDGYKREDVFGETLEGDNFWKQKYDAPKILHTEFDTDDVWKRWKSGLEVYLVHRTNYFQFLFRSTVLMQYLSRTERRPSFIRRPWILPLRLHLLHFPRRVLA